MAAIYIDEDGISHRYNRANFTEGDIGEWIEKKHYQGALLKYKTPALLSGMRTYWAYAKKDVRRFYRNNI